MNELNGLHIAVLVTTGFLLLILLIYMFKNRDSSASAASGKHHKSGNNEKSPVQKTKPCPLCKEPLKPGETVHSIIYPGEPDSLMEIFGCRYCETAPKGRETAPKGRETAPKGRETAPKNKRICPVCKREMAPDAVLIARVFEKPGKKHVHVLGCSRCYSGPSKIHTK